MPLSVLYSYLLQPFRAIFFFHFTESDSPIIPRFHFSLSSSPLKAIRTASAKINVLYGVHFLCIEPCDLFIASLLLAKWRRWRPDDRGETIVLRILEQRSSSSSSSSLPPLLLLLPILRGTDSVARVRRITAINYEGGRPKGVAEERR